jgi:hypothetical protein
MNSCETCFFKESAVDGIFCEYHSESVTGVREDCNVYIPLEKESEVDDE